MEGKSVFLWKACKKCVATKGTEKLCFYRLEGKKLFLLKGRRKCVPTEGREEMCSY